jgi:hypothetical protein
MKSYAWFATMGTALVLAGTSCHKSPEDFCQSWVTSACQAIAGCCQAAASFDGDQCHVELSKQCQTSLDDDQVQSGERKFDSGAANDCFGTIGSCAALATATTDQSYAHKKACANMVTGYRPVGTACASPTDCEKDGDFTVCYGGTGATGGICAKAVLDGSTCSFSFATNELHECTDGSFCDRASFKPNPADPPEKQAFEFSASCVPFLGTGADCSSPTAQCGGGLFCDFAGGTKATCTPQKNAGDTCQSGGGNECAAGLACLGQATGATCQQTGSFCFVPPVCGDHICQPPETPQSCPQDCGGGGLCGDGICEANESPATCPQDCP